MGEIEYTGSWTWELFHHMPCVGLFPPQRYPFEPVCAVWARPVVLPHSTPKGYSRVVEENERYFALIRAHESAQVRAGG